MVSFRSLPLLKQAAKEANPQASVSKGTPIHDLWLTVAGQLLEPFLFDLEAAFGDGFSLKDYENLSIEDMNIKCENLLVFRREGNEGSQRARIIVDTISDLTFGEGEIVAFDANGNSFLNTETLSITKEELDLQRDGLFYYFEAEFVAEEKVSGITQISNMDENSVFNGFVSISGIEETINDGIEIESNEDYYFRTLESVASRALVTSKGTSAIILDNFKNSIQEVKSVGMGDPEMMRDIPRDDEGVPIVNLHLGNHVDAYVKTRSLKSLGRDFINLTYNTRTTRTRSQSVQMDGLNPVYIGRSQVQELVSVQNLSGGSLDVSDFNLDGPAGTVSPSQSSSAKLVFVYTYFPITIDIRSIPDVGRSNYTISDLALCRISSIQELDPGTGTPNGTTLSRNGGFGQGGFGQGSFGVGQKGDWEFHVENPHHRFSVLEKSLIEFEPQHLGKDVRVNFEYAPEIKNVHDFVTQGSERNTAADYLVKNFLPAFVSGDIEIEVTSENPSDINAENAKIAVDSFIQGYTGDLNLEMEKVVELLFANNVYGLNKNFSFKAELHHADGSIQVIKGEEQILTPNPVLPKDTSRPVSKRIVRYYPGEINISVVNRNDV